MKMTIYQAWMENKIGQFGSFQTSILHSYTLADSGNRERLENAFPEWFVELTTF